MKAYQGLLKRVAWFLCLTFLISIRTFAQQMLIFEPFFLDDPDQLPQIVYADQDTDSSLETYNALRSSLSLYEQAVELTELQEGPYSFELVEQLTALGDIYQQLGEHVQAITTFESAQYMLRINNGLFTLEQRPLVEKIVTSYLAMGEIREAQALQEYLFYLYQKNYAPEDPEYLSASLELVQEYLRNHLRQPENLSGLLNTGDSTAPSLRNYRTVFDPFYQYYIFIPRSNFAGFDLTIPCLGAPTTTISNYTVLRLQNDPQFSKARELLDVRLVSETPFADATTQYRLREEIAAIAYLASKQLDFIQTQVSINPTSRANCSWRYQAALRAQEFARGLEALETVVSSVQADPEASLEAKAEAQLNLADWQLAFNNHSEAANLYKAIFDQLQEAGWSNNAILAFMNSSALVLLPAFGEQPYSKAAWGFSPEEHPSYDGYIDVFMTRNATGEFLNINILTTTTEGTTAETLEKLQSLLETQSSRPTLIDGVPLEKEDLRLRYYYKQ